MRDMPTGAGCLKFAISGEDIYGHAVSDASSIIGFPAPVTPLECETMISSLLRNYRRLFRRATSQVVEFFFPRLVYGREARRQTRFSREVYIMLRIAGWYPGRRLLFPSPPYIAPMQGSAKQIFQEFGDLDINLDPRHGPMLRINTPESSDDEPDDAEVTSWTEDFLPYGLYCFGGLEGGPVFVDYGGIVYVLTMNRRKNVWHFIKRVVPVATCFDAALELLLTKKKNVPVIPCIDAYELIDGKWKVLGHEQKESTTDL